MTVYLLVVTIVLSFGINTHTVDNLASQGDCQRLGDAEQAAFKKLNLNADIHTHCYAVRKAR